MRDTRVMAGLAALWLAGCVLLAGAADMAVVDMDRLVKAHPKSEVNRNILTDQIQELESEKEGMLDVLTGKKEAFLAARKQAMDPALSDAVRAERESEVTKDLTELQELEKEMSQRLMGRQREIADQKLRMHKLVEGAVRELVAEVATKEELSLVIDKAAVSVGGSAVVVFHEERLDITDLLLSKIEKLRDE